MKDEFHRRLGNVDRCRRDEAGGAITDVDAVTYLQRGGAHPTGRIGRDASKGRRRVNPSGHGKIASQAGCWHADAHRLTICDEKSPATGSGRSVQLYLGICPSYRN